jgi:hypothetical protein
VPKFEAVPYESLQPLPSARFVGLVPIFLEARLELVVPPWSVWVLLTSTDAVAHGGADLVPGVVADLPILVGNSMSVLDIDISRNVLGSLKDHVIGALAYELRAMAFGFPPLEVSAERGLGRLPDHGVLHGPPGGLPRTIFIR